MCDVEPSFVASTGCASLYVQRFDLTCSQYLIKDDVVEMQHHWVQRVHQSYVAECHTAFAHTQALPLINSVHI